MTYNLLKGNNLELLPTLADNSIDAIVTDPPYGLGNPDPDYIIKAIQLWASGDRSHIPEGKGFMGKSWDAFVPPPAVWDECFRVLKPGGHLLAFAGTRTYDLMGISIRMAGFEIRDSIGWVYGSGFPKSLDVSKAIDKGQGQNLQRQLQFVNWMRTTGLKQQQINTIIGKSDVGSHYLRLDQPAIATADLFDKLRPYLPEVPEEIERLVAERTGIEWKDYKNRKITGEYQQPTAAAVWMSNYGHSADLSIKERKDEASTPEAQQWQGWGTALKPALEPIVVARKPLGGEVSVRCIVENELKKLGHKEITWTKLASDVQKLSQTKNSGSTSLPKTVATSVKNVSESEMPNTEQTTGSFTESQQEDLTSKILAESENLLGNLSKGLKTKSLQPTEKSVNAVESQTEHSSHLTTLKAADQSIESELTAKSGTNLDGKDSPMVIESFAGIATGLTGSLATVLINKLSDGTFQWPSDLPEIHKVGTTVAENVLTYGTGGLNIDASRIGRKEGDNSSAGNRTATFGNQDTQSGGDGSGGWEQNSGGRWPANLILDEYTAGLLDEQAPKTGSKGTDFTGIGDSLASDVFTQNGWTKQGKTQGVDLGGASRFFYVAKASKRDRNEGLEDLPEIKAGSMSGGDETRQGRPTNQPMRQNFHPTVKPTDLMRYLIKLITPPGGTVLDPFTGSGSTGKAAILEGFDFIGIELTEDYWPIIEGRLRHAEAKVAEREKENLLREQEKLF
jgi:DNA modification methylase